MAQPPQNPFEALTVILSVAAVIAIGSLLTTLPAWQGAASTPLVEGYTIPAHLRNAPAHAPAPAQEARPTGLPPALAARVTERFQQAVALLHAKRYDYAITALDAVLEIAPNMPEAYVNMGYAFLGLEEFGPARGAFEKAIELKVDQVNAYYGLAIAFEGTEDYEAALGAMRSYIHLSKPDDPFLTKARAALWEWEAQLGRIKGVAVAKEGEAVPEMPKPSWSQAHNPPAQSADP